MNLQLTNFSYANGKSALANASTLPETFFNKSLQKGIEFASSSS